ncbi:MAG: DinB family protein [Bacteroidota bacterium]
MKKIVLLFCFFLITNYGFTQDKFLQEASKKWQSATIYTQKVTEAMPQKHYGFKPMKDEMSFEDQLLHMANNMNWLGSKFLSEKQAPTLEKLEAKGKSRKEIVQDLKQSMAYIQEIISNFDPTKLDETVDFPAEKLTKRQIITLLNDHHTHHRAQLLVYLRLKDEKPPAYVGW